MRGVKAHSGVESDVSSGEEKMKLTTFFFMLPSLGVALLPAMRGYGAGLHIRGLKRLLEMRIGEDYRNETNVTTANVTTQPTWEEVKERVLQGKFGDFSREPCVQKSYDEFKALILEDWWTFEDYITCRVYEIPFITVKGKRRAWRCWSTDPERRILKQNDFPYLLPRGVKHKIYWCTDESLLERENVEEFVRFHHPLDDVIAWSNPFDMRSFPNVPHAHILIRPNKHFKTVRRPFYWLYPDADPTDPEKTLPPILPDEEALDEHLAAQQREDDNDDGPPPEGGPTEGEFVFYEPPWEDDDEDF